MVELTWEIRYVLYSCEGIHARVRTMMCHIMRPHTCMPQQLYQIREESVQVTLQRILAMFMYTRIWPHDDAQHVHEHVDAQHVHEDDAQHLHEHPLPKTHIPVHEHPGMFMYRDVRV